MFPGFKDNPDAQCPKCALRFSTDYIEMEPFPCPLCGSMIRVSVGYRDGLFRYGQGIAGVIAVILFWVYQSFSLCLLVFSILPLLLSSIFFRIGRRKAPLEEDNEMDSGYLTQLNLRERS